MAAHMRRTSSASVRASGADCIPLRRQMTWEGRGGRRGCVEGATGKQAGCVPWRHNRIWVFAWPPPYTACPAAPLTVVQGVEAAPPPPPLLSPFPPTHLVQVYEQLLLLLVVQSVCVAHVAQRVLALQGGEHNLILTAAGREGRGGVADVGGRSACTSNTHDKGKNLAHTSHLAE